MSGANNPLDPENPGVQRRSVKERLAGRDLSLPAAAEVSFIAEDPTTSTFRIDVTGELVLDEAIPLAHSSNNDKVQGELSLELGLKHHLLAVPGGVSADQIEALAISVWNESGWINPGVLHLFEGVTLNGPWNVSDEVRNSLGLPPSTKQVWLLHCQVMRGAAPARELARTDEWAQAFPDGMPIGAEYKALLVLKRMARRLRAALRVTGSGTVMVPEAESAVNLYVFAPDYVPYQELKVAFEEHFSDIQVSSSSDSALAEKDLPYGMVFPVGNCSQILVGVRPVQHIPRSLRWEDWIRQRVYLYEVTWVIPPSLLVAGQLSRRGRAERNMASPLVKLAASLIASRLRYSATTDADDFRVDLDGPLQVTK